MVAVPAFGDNPGFTGTTTAYTPRTVGVNISGTTFTTLTSGSGPVDAIATFPGFGFQALTSDPLGPTQANINDLEASIIANPANLSFTDCTTFTGVTNCSTATVLPRVIPGIPEPGTFTLLGGGLLAGLGLLRRRRLA